MGLAAIPSEETDELFVVSRTGLQHRIEVGDGPTSCVIFASGKKLAVTHRYDDALWIMDLKGRQAGKRITLSHFQTGAVASADGARLAVAVDGATRGIHFVDLASEREEAFVPLEFVPDAMAFGTDANSLIISDVAGHALRKLQKQTDGWVQTSVELKLSRPVVTIARSRDGQRIYAATTDRPRDQKHNRANHFIQDQILVIDSVTLKLERSFITGRRSTRQDKAGGLDSGISPMDMYETPAGLLRVSFAGSDEVWSFDPTDGNVVSRVRFRKQPLWAPHGLADLGADHWAVASPSQGALAVFGPGDKRLAVNRVVPPDARLAKEDPVALTRRRGERCFYEATRTGISCQSCHLHGDTDHSRHNIGQRLPLHTLNIRGVAHTAPYLRDGSFARVSDLQELAHGLFRGYRRRQPGRGALLQAYVYGLALPTRPAFFGERKSERERKGLDAFMKAECSVCHSFPAFTNLGQHPVRSLFPDYGQKWRPKKMLDVPSLLGLVRTAPYLHDGRAKKLSKVLTDHNTANRHGNVAALSEQEQAALVDFLEGL